MREKGRKDFHVRDISWSYRMRGRVARNQTNRNAKIIALIVKIRSKRDTKIKGIGSQMAVVIRHIMIILVYSAIKIRAKFPALYSILNPETSSDSPSARSNGVRLVSAKVVMNQQKNKGANIRAGATLWVACA